MLFATNNGSFSAILTGLPGTRSDHSLQRLNLVTFRDRFRDVFAVSSEHVESQTLFKEVNKRLVLSGTCPGQGISQAAFDPC